VQENIAEVAASQHGIKVVLSIVSADEKHLPPHAVELLHPAERTVLVSCASQDVDPEAHGNEAVGTTAADHKPPETETKNLGLSKKQPEARRCRSPRQHLTTNSFTWIC
jgi:hypothetical protein